MTSLSVLYIFSEHDIWVCGIEIWIKQSVCHFWLNLIKHSGIISCLPFPIILKLVGQFVNVITMSMWLKIYMFASTN